MSMIKLLTELKEPKISDVGGKGYSLATLINNGFNVPKGFVIFSDVFFEYLRKNNLTEKTEKLASEINESNFQEKSKETKNLILSGELPDEIILEIKSNLSNLNFQYVSIRSSAVSEDSLKASFAGLHDTFLNIRSNLDMILEYTKKCWASLFNERALIYRIKKEIPHLEGIAVVIQEMIPAEISGITFTVHPSDKKSLLEEVSYGLGDMIVGGKIDPDDYAINRETLEIVDKRIGSKGTTSVLQGGKIEVVNTKEDDRKKQVLTEGKIREIAKISLKIEKIFNAPQDIEWCISKNKLWILQSRVITGGNLQYENR